MACVGGCRGSVARAGATGAAEQPGDQVIAKAVVKKRKIQRGGNPGAIGYGDLATSLLLIFPLFLAYEVGVMFSSTVNGVDFVSRFVFSLAETRRNYLIIHGVLAAGFLVYLLYLRRTRSFSVRELAVPMLLESCIYALTLGTFIVFVMHNLLGFDGGLAVGEDLALGETGEAIVISLGAGVHEELVFRLGLMAGATWALMKTGMTRGWALVAALAASAVIFSLAHHVGPQGDPFKLGVFTYRALAGVIFGLIFYYRSLAHAVYSHFLYDVYVLVVRS